MAIEADFSPVGASFFVRKTVKPKDYVRLIPRRDANGVVQAYFLDVDQPGHDAGGRVPVVVDATTGATEQPKLIYEISPNGDNNDPFEETEYVYRQGTSEARIWFSERGGHVTRWKSVFGAPYNLSLEWLARNGPLGLGVAMGGSSRWFEYWNTVGANMHNPTHSGGFNHPFETKIVSDQLTAPISHRLYTEVTSSKLAGAKIPYQWDMVGDVEPAFNPAFFAGATQGNIFGNPHAGEAERHICWWRFKRQEILEPHFGGREFVHRLTYWDYLPEERKPETFGGTSTAPLTVRTREELDNVIGLIQQLGFDTCHFMDLVNDSSLTEITNFESGVTSTFGAWQFASSFTRYLADVAQPDTAASFPSGYAFMVMSRSSDGFAHGVIVKMQAGTFAQSEVIEGAMNPNVIEVRNRFSPNTFAGGPAISHDQPHDTSWVVRVSSQIGRKAGWSGYHYHMYVGPFSQALTTAQEVFSSGIMDDVADSTLIPAFVRARTDLADAAPSAVSAPARITPSRLRFASNLK